MQRQTLEILEVNHQRFQDVAQRAKASLDPNDAELIEKVFASYEYVTSLIQDKNLSIARLQKMLFGAKTEKTETVIGNAMSPSSASGEPETSSGPADPKPPRKGHGRNGAAAYQGAKRIEVPHPSLQPGDACRKRSKNRSITVESGL